MRSIPSALDGLKVSQRKVAYSCFKRNLREEIKVAQLSGYVSEHAAYHHGEASLHGAIIGLAQDFVGKNNLNILAPVGQFGSRLAGGSDSASPRYIHTHLTKIARLIFLEDDDAILSYTEDDGSPVEPTMYLPILPWVLVNGAAGIGTGYSTNVPCYNPMDLIKNIKRLFEGLPPTEITPWFRGFKGTLEVIQGKLQSRGIHSRTGPTKIRITELPLSYWTEDFKEAVEAFIDKNADARSFSNESTDTAIDFTLTFSDSAAADAFLARDSDGIARIEHELKLFNSNNLSITNMHLFDVNGRIKKYADVDEILRDFYSARMEGYEKRKKRKLEDFAHKALLMNEKVRFLDMVIDGSLCLHKMTTSSHDEELAKMKLATFNGDYKYLTSMPMSSLTVDRKVALEEELKKTQLAIEELEGTTPIALWAEDLNALESKL